MTTTTADAGAETALRRVEAAGEGEAALTARAAQAEAESAREETRAELTILRGAHQELKTSLAAVVKVRLAPLVELWVVSGRLSCSGWAGANALAPPGSCWFLFSKSCL